MATGRRAPEMKTLSSSPPTRLAWPPRRASSWCPDSGEEGGDDLSEAAPGDSALRPLAGGKLLAEITNRIVAFMREHYGRGPIKANTYVLDNLIVCGLSDGFTAIERTMVMAANPNGCSRCVATSSG